MTVYKLGAILVMLVREMGAQSVVPVMEKESMERHR